MKGNETVIKHLNQVLKNELTAINQYFCIQKCLKIGDMQSLVTMNTKNQ